jgi:hypothetical protein
VEYNNCYVYTYRYFLCMKCVQQWLLVMFGKIVDFKRWTRIIVDLIDVKKKKKKKKK